MMQPEDIILAKEWEQLSEDEKKIIAPLAATEGEYGVLKKMLLLVQEDALQVPQVSITVQQQLQRQLHPSKPSKMRSVWYAAAASVLALLVAGYFFLLPQKQENIAIIPNRKPTEKASADTTKKSIPQAPSLPVDPSGSMAKKEAGEKTPAKRKNDPADLVQTAQTSTAVNDNIALLDLVTEVY